MADGVVFTGALAERVVEATRWVERHMGGRGPGPTPPPGVEPVFCRVTSGTADGDGNYPGVVTAWSAAAAAWTDFGACVVKPANGEALADGTRYLCRPGGRTAGGNEVYVTTPTQTVLRGKLDGALSAGGSATMSVWAWNGSAEADTGVNVTVYDWLLASGSIASGKKVVACHDPASGRYYVIAAEC